jgi:Domain of unknown function (DUF6362)
MQDAVEVFDQITRAVRTLRRLPPEHSRAKFCNWPPIIRSFYEIWRDGVTTPPRIGVTSKQVTEMDAVIRWLAWLSQHPGFGAEYTRIIWARAEKRSWRKIGVMAGKSKDTCRERFRVGLHALLYGIQDGKVH